MNRRGFLRLLGSSGLLGFGLSLAGCRGKQYAHVLDEDDPNMVGSHAAGSEVYEKQIEEAVGKLLGRQMLGVKQVSHEGVMHTPKRICFVGVENKSAEELSDFKQHLYEIIDQKIKESDVFECIAQRVVAAGLHEANLRADDLAVPSKRKLFLDVMEQQGEPFDYLLFAILTSGTTKSNGEYQRDYLLTLELLDLHTLKDDKVSAKVRKGYHKSVLGRIKHY